MRKKELVKLLRSVSKETTEQISRDYPGLTETDHARLFQRIEQQLQEEKAAQDAPHTVVHEVRFTWVRQTAAAAACILVCTATLAGLSTLRTPSPSREQEESTLAYTIGKRYEAANLTQSGTLWITVNSAEPAQEDGLYHVSVTLESEKAVSFAERSVNQPYLFMADNFMAAVGHHGENWLTVQPCAMYYTGTKGSTPYAFLLYPGETCELELWYQLNSAPSEWMLVTSCSDACPYTLITTKED